MLHLSNRLLATLKIQMVWRRYRIAINVMPPDSGNIIGKVAHQTWFEGSSMKYEDTHTHNDMACANPFSNLLSCFTVLFAFIISPSENLAHDQAFEQTESQSQPTIVHTTSWKGSDSLLSNELQYNVSIAHATLNWRNFWDAQLRESEGSPSKAAMC